MEEKKVPALRFRGFDNAWEQRRAKDIFVAFADKGYPELPVLSATQDRGMIRRDENSINIHHDKKNEEGYKRVLPGQFVIHLRSFQGGFAHSTIEGITSPAYIVFGFAESKDHCSEYWKYIFISETFIKRLETVTYGIRDGRSISYDEFLTLSFVIPYQEEQIRIAQYLKKLDHLISLHQRKLEMLKKVKKSMLEKMFPKNDAKVPEVRFSDFTDAWEQCKVSEIFKIARGYVLAATETADIKDDKNCYPVYSSQTKNEGLMGFYSEYLYENTITWTTDGANAGTVRYRSGKFYCTNVCGILLSEEGYANKAVSEALNSVAWKYVSYVGNPKLMNNVMADIEIVIPKSVKEQETISRYFDEIDDLIILHQRKLEKLKNIKKSMLEKMFII